MQGTPWAARLWGNQARLTVLLVATLVLLFGMLGAREIWTQEHRWADIVYYMFYHHDFLHPVLNGNEYYDKPLLSYWFISAIVAFSGKITTWAIRLPSAFAGLLAIWSLYRIGTQLENKHFGLLAAWLLLTTYYFSFWSRVSSTDMLNLGGILYAVAWYSEHRQHTTFYAYSVFFLIMAITALCKGLVAPAVVLLVVLPDLVLQKTWKKHAGNWRLWVAWLPALFVYVLPFWASAYFGGQHYQSNGLGIMYRENIMRYFKPFDHQEPLYVYFIYLPVYLLPWAFFFVPALVYCVRHFRSLTKNVQWMGWALLALFLFFTLSGSRRGYYVLPLVPFALLLTAYWIQWGVARYRWAGYTAVVFYSVFAFNYIILQPLFYSSGGVMTFAEVLHHTTDKRKPWSAWQFTLLDAQTKVSFYLHLSPDVKNYGIYGLREEQTVQTLQKTWPPFKTIPTNTIIITRRLYEPVLNPVLKDFILVEAAPNYLERFLHKKDPDAPVAYVPKSY